MVERFKTGVEAVKALPPTLMIGAFVWTLEKWDTDEANALNRYGECVSYRLILRIRADMPSAQKAADTFLHEVLHAMHFVYGVWDEDKEERRVGALSTALLALHRHNPWLGGWLERCL